MIQPINIYIPPDIEAGLAAGELTKNGSVVRWVLTKAIHAHLDEVPLEDEVPDEAGTQGLSRNAKRVLTLVAVGAGIGLCSWYLSRKYRAPRKDIPHIIEHRAALTTEYRTALEAYLAAIKAGVLDQMIIHRLVSAIDALTALNDGVAVPLEISSDELLVLTKFVEDHSRKLAAANDLDLPTPGSPPSSVDQLAELRRRLVAQRAIFDEAA